MHHRFMATLLIASWLVVIAIFMVPQAENRRGLPHPEHAAMDQGGDGLGRHEQLIWPVWLFGSLQILFVIGLLVWSAAKVTQPRRDRPAGPAPPEFLQLEAEGANWLVVGGLLFEGIFAALCWSYAQSLTDSEVAFIGPFPSGLTWLLFGIWLFPAYFIVLYVKNFDRWIYPEDSRRRFAELTVETQNTERT